MRDVMTMRLEPALRRRLDAAAERRALTSSAAVRVAIERWLEAEDAGPATRVADLLGCFSGPRELSLGGGKAPRRSR